LIGKKFYSNGKLLITGEYLVLQGATALAVPTIPGQEMLVSAVPGSGPIRWQSYFREKCWFEAGFSVPGYEVLNATNKKAASYIAGLLREARRLNPETTAGMHACKVKAILGFDPLWGLGSSSSLIRNIAAWFEIDPFTLFFNTQKGSAYDIACAGANSAIHYRLENNLPQFESAAFNPPFRSALAFVYSGRKQDSDASIGKYLRSAKVSKDMIKRISQIGGEVAQAQNQQDFNRLIDEHEDLLALILRKTPIRKEFFSDFPGSLKSLGAWGGDFFLASAEGGMGEIKSYFSAKGFQVLFGYDELVLNKAGLSSPGPHGETD
jgi:mevalonate kinase